MREYGKRLAALALASCMVLGLAACGGKTDGGDTQKRTGTVYVPSFVSVEADKVEYINQGCADSQYIYFTADTQGEEHEETYTWEDENGEEQTETYTYYDYRTGLFRVPLEGGAAVELENYEPLTGPEEVENSYTGVNNIRAGGDGTLWVTEYVNWWYYDLPENFNPETDDQWAYEVNGAMEVLRQLDSTGKELSRTELSSDLAEKAGLESLSSMAFDNDGNIFLNSDTKIAVLDKDQNLLFTLEGENLWGQMVLLGDGTVGLSSSYYDQEKESHGYRMRTIDLSKQDWGPSYELSQSAYNVFPGGGDFLFYYQNNDSIYGFKAGASEGEKIFSWIDSDINSNAVQFFTFLTDGRIAALTREWGMGADRATYEAAILTPTDASTLPEKVILTYATMGLDYSVRGSIIDFNKTSDRYRIEVLDYSECNTGEDASAGLTKMNTEILAGRVPDILDASSNMPISQYAARGLLEDLWPYIEQDQEIGGRAGVMENVFKAAEQDGKLYQIFGKFDIRTVEGARSVVGDRMSWTLADLQAALAAMPEGCTPFAQDATRSNMLSNIMSCNIDSFVDWFTGSCSFDSDTFKALLAFCADFPEEFSYDNIDWDTWEEEDQRIRTGKQLLRSVYVDTFVGLQTDKSIFGGDVSYVGYPMEDGSVGSSFQPMGSSFAMSAASKNKEGVWSFIRQVLLPMDEEDFENLWDFPMNSGDFEKYKTKAMTVEYVEDEDGQQVMDENGEPIKVSKRSYWIDEDNIIEVYAATQEEVDQIMALYNAITTIWRYDQSVYDIVEESAGPYFSGDWSLDDTARRIQSSVKLYIGEQR